MLEKFYKYLIFFVALFAVVGSLYAFAQYLITELRPEPEIILKLSARSNELTSKDNPIAEGVFTPLSDRIVITIEGSAWLKSNSFENKVGYILSIRNDGKPVKRYTFSEKGTVGLSSEINQKSTTTLQLNKNKKYQISLHLIPGSRAATDDIVSVKQVPAN